MKEQAAYDAQVRRTLAQVALRLRKCRADRRLTVQQLADRCNIERSNLSRIESGRVNVTLRMLCILCHGMDMEIRDLFAEDRTNVDSGKQNDNTHMEHT